MSRSQLLVAVLALSVSAASIAQDLGKLPDSIQKEQKRLDRFVSGDVKSGADEIGRDLSRGLTEGKANDRDILGELNRRIQNYRGRRPTSTEADVISARALSTALNLQDREVREVFKYRDDVTHLRRRLSATQDAVNRRGNQLGFSVRSYKANTVGKPFGWPMNEPILAGRSGVPINAYTKEELGQTYWNAQQQLEAIDKASTRLSQIEGLTGRRARMIEGLGSLFDRTTKLSDAVLRGIR